MTEAQDHHYRSGSSTGQHGVSRAMRCLIARQQLRITEYLRWRSYGSENWAFDAHRYMNRREASISDIAITAAERRLFGPRPSAEYDHTLPPQ